jgi:hypothetical protein
MIRFIVAPPGSGKTLVIVQREIPHALKAGKKVFHNIRGLDVVRMAYYCKLYPEDVEKQLEYMYLPCIEEYAEDNSLASELGKIGASAFEEKYAKDLSAVFKSSAPAILARIARLPNNYLVVVDEVQNFVPATDFKEEKNVKFFEYATVHRHLGHDLVLATQHEDNVDVKLRRIANLLVYMYRRDILGFLFRNTVTEKHYAGCATGNPELLNKYVTKYDKRVFKLYKSYAAGDVVETRKFRSIWLNKKLIVLLVIAAVCLSFVPRFLRNWNIVGKKAVPVLPSPRDYLGDYSDYYCGKKLYVLRHGGGVEIWPSEGVPVSVCPSDGYSPSKIEVAK